MDVLNEVAVGSAGSKLSSEAPGREADLGLEPSSQMALIGKSGQKRHSGRHESLLEQHHRSTHSGAVCESPRSHPNLPSERSVQMVEADVRVKSEWFEGGAVLDRTEISHRVLDEERLTRRGRSRSVLNPMPLQKRIDDVTQALFRRLCFAEACVPMHRSKSGFDH